MFLINWICILLPSILVFHLDGIHGERKLTAYPCHCGVKHVKNNETVTPWTLHVHLKISPAETRTCVGTVIASNVVLTSKACVGLDAGPSAADGTTTRPTSLSGIVVSEEEDIGKGATYPVIATLAPNHDSQFIGLRVDHDFTSRGNPHMPVCVPTTEELPSVVEVGSNVTIKTGTMGDLTNLVIKKGKECGLKVANQLATDGMNEQVLCVSVADKNIKLEVGLPLYVEVGKNRYQSYPLGFFTYLIGIAEHIQTGGDGRREILFEPVQSFVQTVESMTSRSVNTSWCSQPWPWLITGGKFKRDKSLKCECGLAKEVPKGRVVGGQDANPYEFPWMAKLRNYFLNGGVYLHDSCGGTIINDRMILTATHCITSFDLAANGSVGYDIQGVNQSYTAFLHSHKLGNDPQEIPITTKLGIIHPAFIDGIRGQLRRFEGDVALLILNEPLDFTLMGPDGEPLYRPICLPNYGEQIEIYDREALVAGWGKNSTEESENFDSLFPGQLQKAMVTIKPIDTCGAILGPVNILNAVLCTVWENGTGTYRGDSGGPISVADKNGRQVQVGVTSYTLKGVLSMFADLQELLPFIDYYSDLYKGKYCVN